jgi:ankyrin repeat protein
LHLAAFGDHAGVVRALLDVGGDASMRDAEGATPLLVAVTRSSNAAFAALVPSVPQLDATDGEGFTALHNAAYNGEIGMIQELLARGCAVNPEADDRSTPLDWAVIEGNDKAAQKLQEHGARRGTAPAHGDGAQESGVWPSPAT